MDEMLVDASVEIEDKAIENCKAIPGKRDFGMLEMRGLSGHNFMLYANRASLYRFGIFILLCITLYDNKSDWSADMKSKGTFNGRQMSLSLQPYKNLGFYQLLDPDGPRLYGYHVFSTALKLFLLVVQCFTIFGVLGFAVKTEDEDGGHHAVKSNTFEVIVILTNCTLSSLKMYTFLSNANSIWTFFDMACTDFLKSSRRDDRIEAKFAKRFESSSTVTKLIAHSFLGCMILWFAGPFVADDETQLRGGRRQNIINVKFPVTKNVYNEYFYAFYFIELSIGFCIVYGSVLVDAFLMSFCWIISARYQSVAALYETFGHDQQQLLLSEPQTTKMEDDGIDDFKSIIIDHQNVYLKMKSFYTVVRPITLIHVFAYSCSLIVYSYIIVKILNSNESFNIAEMMKICMTISNVTIEIYIYCYLFELVDEKKDAINFGLYSCNWTQMDMKFKKLLLTSMKMNNANRLKLKATANITIGRPFFANVIHNCFKIVSVLKQTQSNDFQN